MDISNATNIGFIILVLFMLSVILFWHQRSGLVNNLNKKAVLITGCDSGFGQLLAIQMDKLGVTVYAGCLFPGGDGAKLLRSVCSDRLHILQLDVTKKEQIQNAFNYVVNSLEDKELFAVVNNAGIIAAGLLEWMSEETLEKVLNVNTYGPFRISKVFLPLLRKSEGRLVIVCSLASHVIAPGLGVYCISKYATYCLAESLSVELAPFKISVHTIKPYTYRSNLNRTDLLQKDAQIHWDQLSEETRTVYGDKYFQEFKDSVIIKWLETAQPDERVQDVINDMLDAALGSNPKDQYIPGLIPKIIYFAYKHVPSILIQKYVASAYMPNEQFIGK